MAVEKMVMLNVVGKLDDLENILLDILKSESIDMVDAMTQLSKNNAIYELNAENVDMIVDLNNLGPFVADNNNRKRTQQARQLMEYFGIENLEAEQEGSSEYTEKDFDKLYEETANLRKEIEDINKRLEVSKNISQNLALFRNVDVDLRELKNMEYFTARFGRVEKTARLKLKENYDHILAAVFHTGSYENEEVYLVIYPNEVHEEIDRILSSLHWIDVPILEYSQGSAKETLNQIEAEAAALNNRLEEIEVEKQTLYKSKTEEIHKILARMLMLGRIEEAKAKMAKAKKYFLLSGWASEDGFKDIKQQLEKYSDTLITAVDADGEDIIFKPPTKLKNNSFFKPFELLVRMYGVPNYNEIDPTVFLGITYMILFGAMFGDLGQGFVFFLAGMFLKKKLKNDMGPLLMRLGASSMVFGVLYGSVFGNEEIIQPLWIRPFENINQVLIMAISFGVFLLVMAYVMNFINAFKNRDLNQGLFGEHGLFGFIVFAMLIFLLLDATGYVHVISTSVALVVLILAILAMIFRKPILSKIYKQEVSYEEGKAGYFIESSFSIIELLISTLSGIVSFIRVGAFAINHVGLFLAFHTMAEMTNHTVGNVLILVLGNILIIGLEGLIVFIQGLRLEYYELFSRYYQGSGVEFKSDKINFRNIERGGKKWK